jgi:hypothetical protein
MNAVNELELARPDLGELLIEVLAAVVGHEVADGWDQPIEAGAVVLTRLVIHDQSADDYTLVDVRTGLGVARLLAGLMLEKSEPDSEDVLDVVGELGNILGGNVKTLLRHSARLSLPVSELTVHVPSDAAPLDGVTVRAALFGQIVELNVRPTDSSQGLPWPGQSLDDEVLENQP